MHKHARTCTSVHDSARPCTKHETRTNTNSMKNAKSVVHARTCTIVHKHAQACTNVHKCAQVCTSVHDRARNTKHEPNTNSSMKNAKSVVHAQTCTIVHKHARTCTSMHKH